MSPSASSRSTHSKHRSRGGQPGNRNAIKHGFYSRQFTPLDIDDLSATEPTSVVDEIAMIRVQLRQLLEKYSEVETLEQALEFARVISLVTICLTRLVKAQYFITPDSEDSLGAMVLKLAPLALEELRARDRILPAAAAFAAARRTSPLPSFTPGQP